MTAERTTATFEALLDNFMSASHFAVRVLANSDATRSEKTDAESVYFAARKDVIAHIAALTEAGKADDVHMHKARYRASYTLYPEESCMMPAWYWYSLKSD